MVFTSSIWPTVNTSNATQAIVFNGTAGTMYGDVTLGFDVAFPAGRTLGIADGQTLTVPSGKTLTNAGTINNSGTVTGNPVQ